MELSYLMLTGSLSGLLSVLSHSVLWSALEVLRIRATSVNDGSAVQVLDALLHMVSGAALGLLFWLSWGLAAVVDVPWWLRGLSFGSLCWLALPLPTTLAIAMARSIPATATVLLAARWATTCLIAGLACAWSWKSVM